MSSPRLEDLLATWEGTYKKGLLTFWILLILSEQESYAGEMAGLIRQASQDTLTADDNSLYRALGRFEGLGIISSDWRDSEVGPPRRYYRLTPTGRGLLRAFIRRNVLIFQSERVAPRIRRVLDRAVARK